MNIKTTFEIGQKVYSISTRRVMDTLPCPACAGESKIELTGADGSKFRVDCPNAYGSVRTGPPCISGQIHVGRKHVRGKPQALTVGQITVVVGYGAEERIMCRETGLGSGSVHRVVPEKIGKNSSGFHNAIFGSKEAAIEWADNVVLYCNSILRGDV